MLTLLHPAALLALTGLLVPVAIHLWNRRPGREVAVGSLRWLAAGANRRLRNLKLEQLWLLLLRATLLAVLAVAVAGPAWRTTQPTSRGVVLLSPEVLGNPALAALRPGIDSLRRRGYGLRWLAKDFPRVPSAAWRAAGHSGGATDSVPTDAFAWARVQQAAAAFPGQPLVVVTSAHLRNWQGSHAPLPERVSWQVLPDTATTSWLAAAELVGDSLQLLVGQSSETRTSFCRKKVLEQRNGYPIRVAGLAPVRFHSNKNGGGPVLVPVASAARKNEIGVDASTPVIEIYASPEFATDARYLEAALRAAAAGMPIPLLLRRVKARPKELNANWTFWLSAEPLPQNWQTDLEKHGRQLWQEAAGPGVADTAQLATAAADATPVTVFRRDAIGASSVSNTLWADGLGRPVLTQQVLGNGAVYQLHTRLHPDWSQLADDPEFPARLLALLQPEATDEAATLFRPRNPKAEQRLAAFDQRALDPAQLAVAQPVASPVAGPPVATFRFTDLRPWLVLAAGLLLLLERLLARRRETHSSSIAP